MKARLDLSALKRIPIIEVAKRLGIQIQGSKAMCFTGHDKATPSLSFLKSKNTWRCFGACGKHGDAIALVMEKEELDFKSTLAWFAKSFGVDVTTNKITTQPMPDKLPTATMALSAQATGFSTEPELYAWLVENCPAISSAQGMNYLNAHGISLETASRFHLREITNPKIFFDRLVAKWGTQRVYQSGIAWGEHQQAEKLIWDKPALLIPFFQHGAVIYLQARMFAGGRKYLNPRGIAKPMFNGDRLADLPAGGVIHLCEGVPDTLALEAHALAAVGVLGATSFRPEWVERFAKFKVIVLEQGDAAGKKFAADIISFFRTRGKSVEGRQLPAGKDAADIYAAGENL